jgi:hypothetical protein
MASSSNDADKVRAEIAVEIHQAMLLALSSPSS